MNDKKRILVHKRALERKLDKINSRIKIIDRYVSDPKSKDMTLKQWLESKGLDIKNHFSAIGFDCIADKGASHDSENEFIKFYKTITYDKAKGFPVIEKTEGISNMNGYVFNKKLNQYFPVADTPRHKQEIANQNTYLSEIGGLNIDNVGDLNISSPEKLFKLYWLKEALGSEYDNVEGEFLQFYDDSHLRIRDRERRINERKGRMLLQGNPF